MLSENVNSVYFLMIDKNGVKLLKTNKQRSNKYQMQGNYSPWKERWKWD